MSLLLRPSAPAPPPKYSKSQMLTIIKSIDPGGQQRRLDWWLNRIREACA
jgi:hypothetical protein